MLSSIFSSQFALLLQKEQQEKYSNMVRARLPSFNIVLSDNALNHLLQPYTTKIYCNLAMKILFL